MSQSGAACPPIEDLERVAAGEPLGPLLRAHVDECANCRESLTRIHDNNQFLLDFAIRGALPAPAPRDEEAAISLPGYELLGETHRGGQGVVFQARQLSTKRDVAIKVMKQGPFATLADRARFDREIETLARLDHPNIIAVHDAGVVSGVHYFVMNYVDGLSLDAFVASLDSSGRPRRSETVVAGAASSDADLAAARVRRGLAPVTAVTLDLMATVCEAVHAAHLRGVIHRDLKPSNVRVDRSGVPFVLDFGLAKTDAGTGESAMTRTGQFVGSLPWASPEQVEGSAEKIDLRTDVYSLGAMLYQLLTGQLPFDLGSNLREALDQILFKDPPRPSHVRSGSVSRIEQLDDELDTIVLKCLSKDRERRYQSAGDLARDLRHYLAGAPIEAKRDSAVYMLRKALRRYRLRFIAGGLFLALLAGSSIVMTLLYRRSAKLEQAAVQSAESLAESLAAGNIEQGRMAGMLGNLQIAEELLWRELLLRRRLNRDAPLVATAPPGAAEPYWALWEAYRRRPCLRTVAPRVDTKRTTVVSGDGDGVWSSTGDSALEHLSESGETTARARIPAGPSDATRILQPDGRSVLYVAKGGLHLGRPGAERPLEFPLEGMTNTDFDVVCLSAKQTWLAAPAKGEVVVWRTHDAEEYARFRVEGAELVSTAISNDERRLAARDAGGDIHIWDLESKRTIARSHLNLPATENLNRGGQLLYSADDRLLADAWFQTVGRIWTLQDGAPVSQVELAIRPGLHRFQAFSSDNQLLAVGDMSGTVRLYDVASGACRREFVAHADRIHSVGFVHDNRALWTIAWSEFRLWEVAPDAGIRTLRMDGEPLHSVDAAPDGSWLIASGQSGKLFRVEAASGERRSFDAEASTIFSVSVSSDGRHVAAAAGENALLWNAQRLQDEPQRLSHPKGVTHVAFSPDGNALATCSFDNIVRLWTVADGRLALELPGAQARIPQLSFDPRGGRVAGGARDGSLFVWRLADGSLTSRTAGAPLRGTRFSPDGDWLILTGSDRTISVWDAQELAPSQTFSGHKQDIYAIDIRADGQYFATGDAGGVIQLWHLPTRRHVATLEGHSGAIMKLRFVPQTSLLASVSLDGTLRLWDLDYYRRHIAGQVDAQLKRLSLDDHDPRGAAAWRTWAREIENAATP